MSRITCLSIIEPYRLELIEPDDAEYPITFRCVCTHCGHVVLAHTYAADVEAQGFDAFEPTLIRDAAEAALVSSYHTCSTAIDAPI
jgi:hypothetical protein